MINHSLHREMALTVQQNNERTIAAAERRRLAKAVSRAEGSPDDVATDRFPRLSGFGSVAGAWNWLGRGLSGVVGRHAPA
jgi:hypothetical protein